MTRMTEYEVIIMNRLQVVADKGLLNMRTSNQNYNLTKVQFYELIRDYFNELADNERSKIKIVPPTEETNWKLELS